MKKYPTMIFATAIMLIGVCEQATAMTAVHTETKAAKRASYCEQVMAWLEDCFAHEETIEEMISPAPTVSPTPLDDATTIKTALEHFDRKPVITCNFDTLCKNPSTLKLYWQLIKRGFTIFFLAPFTSAQQKWVTGELEHLEIYTENIIFIKDLTAAKINRLQREERAAVIAEWMVQARKMLEERNYCIIGSIDHVPEHIQNAAYPICLTNRLDINTTDCETIEKTLKHLNKKSIITCNLETLLANPTTLGLHHALTKRGHTVVFLVPRPLSSDAAYAMCKELAKKQVIINIDNLACMSSETAIEIDKQSQEEKARSIAQWMLRARRGLEQEKGFAIVGSIDHIHEHLTDATYPIQLS